MMTSACQSSLPSTRPTNELTPQEEQLMARQILPEIRRDYPALQNEALQQKLTNIGEKLITSSDLEGSPYHFSFVVVDVPSITAFAVPAGSIFVTQPLMQFVESNDELAGIIAHEIAHVILQHTSQKILMMEKEKQKSWHYGLGGALIGAGVGIGVSSAICAGNSTCGAALIGAGTGTGLQAGLLTQKYLFLKRSQKEELDADLMGFAITERAGFRVSDMELFFRRIEKVKELQNKRPTTLWTNLLDRENGHPSAKERLQQLTDFTKSQGPSHSPQIIR